MKNFDKPYFTYFGSCRKYLASNQHILHLEIASTIYFVSETDNVRGY